MLQNSNDEACLRLFMNKITKLTFIWDNKKFKREILLDVQKSLKTGKWCILEGMGSAYNFEAKGFCYMPLNSSKDDEWFDEHFRSLNDCIRVVNMILSGHLDPYEENELTWKKRKSS